MQTSITKTPQDSRAFVFSAAFILLVLMFGLTTALSGTLALTDLLGSSIILTVLTVALAAWACIRNVSFDVLPNVKRAHWIQACVHTSIFLAIATWSEGMRAYLPLIVFQLVFAHMVQLLLGCALRRRLELSFAVFPIVLSINLFLWFEPFQFHCQLLMVALAIAAKLFLVRPNGRHIFNPSAIAAAIAIYGIIAFYPPFLPDLISPELIMSFDAGRPYLFYHIILVSLVSLSLGDRFLVAASGLFVMDVAYWGAKLLLGTTLTPFVMDPNLLVGFTLLVTDPVTSPKSRGGQVLFGGAYGLSVIAALFLLDALHVATFFDKILFVPLLNAAVPWFEQAAAALGKAGGPRMAALAGLMERRRMQIVAYVAICAVMLIPVAYPENCYTCHKIDTGVATTAKSL